MENEAEITLAWENNVGFCMTQKVNSDPEKIIIKLEENGDIASLWPHIEDACQQFFNNLLSKIGSDMRAE